MKKKRIVLSAVMVSVLLAGHITAQAAWTKGSAPEKTSEQVTKTVETEAIETGAVETEIVETDAVETEIVETGMETAPVETGAAPADTAAVPAKMEGDGFLMPQDALAAYIRGLQNNDFDEMISTFAIESYAKNYDMARTIERMKAYIPTIGFVPSVSDFSVRLNAEIRRKNIVDMIRAHYLLLTESPVMDEENSYKPIQLTEDYESGQALADVLFTPSDESYLGNIRFDGEFYSPAVLSDHYIYNMNLHNLKKMADQIHAQGITSVAAKLYCNDRPFLITMDAVLYGSRWYLLSAQGNIGNLLGISTFYQGLVPMDAMT